MWSAGERYEGYVGRWSRRLAPAFLAWSQIPPDARALDVGCGTGALTAALLAHGATRVAGVDPSMGFLSHARAAIPQADFHAGDARALPFSDATFDAVASALALNFVPDPPRAVREMRRVARQGGAVALYVWDYAGKMEPMRLFWGAAVEADPAAGAVDETTRFPICQPEALAQAFEDAGFRDVATTGIEIPVEYASFDEYWEPFLSGTGPAPSYCASRPPELQASIRAILRERVPAREDGRIALTARAWAVRGAA